MSVRYYKQNNNN